MSLFLASRLALGFLCPKMALFPLINFSGLFFRQWVIIKQDTSRNLESVSTSGLATFLFAAITTRRPRSCWLSAPGLRNAKAILGKAAQGHLRTINSQKNERTQPKSAESLRLLSETNVCCSNQYCLLCDVIVVISNLYTSSNVGYTKASLFNFFFLFWHLSLIPFSYAQITTGGELHPPTAYADCQELYRVWDLTWLASYQVGLPQIQQCRYKTENPLSERQIYYSKECSYSIITFVLFTNPQFPQGIMKRARWHLHMKWVAFLGGELCA